MRVVSPVLPALPRVLEIKSTEGDECLTKTRYYGKLSWLPPKLAQGLVPGALSFYRGPGLRRRIKARQLPFYTSHVI